MQTTNSMHPWKQQGSSIIITSNNDPVNVQLTKADLISMLAKVSEVNGHAQHAPGLWQCPNDYCPVCMHNSMTQGCSPEPEAQSVVFTDELDSPRNDPNLS